MYLSFEGVKSEFAIENMTLKVPEIVTRDVSGQNLYIRLPFGEGKIEQIIYTTLETSFDIQWTIHDASEQELEEFLEQYTGRDRCGDQTVEYEMLHPLPQAVRDSAAASQYLIYDQFTVPAAFDPQETLLIDLIGQDGITEQEQLCIP